MTPDSTWRRYRPILLFGAAGGLLAASLRFIEYRFLIVEHSVAIYGALVALLFAAVGIRLGLTLTAGKSTREIAGTLFVSENTVKTHASRLYDKLGVRRRTQAVQEARRLGLLP